MIQILNKRSASHHNWCEDNYWFLETEDYIYGAVLDGCSTGHNSHFASTFVKYALEKGVGKVVDIDECPFNTLADHLATYVLDKMKVISASLDLTDMNLLSTIVFFAYSKEDQELYVKFFGDGVVYVNGEEFVHDEANTPQYLAYQLYASEEDFQVYLNTRKEQWFQDVKDFSICSDGIHSFRNLKNSALDRMLPVQLLVNSDIFAQQKTGLSKKFNILSERNPGYISNDDLSWWDIQDDLTIIRYTE
jgi:Protein phosphatase 2C